MTHERRILLFSLVAALLLALAAAACSSGGGRETADAGGGDDASVELSGGGGEPASESEGELGSTPEGISREEADLQPAPADQTSTALPGVGPRVVQTATIRLRLGRGGFDKAVDDARTIASGLGGLVVSSSASQEGQGRLVSGSLVVRVPSRHYARAMSSLGRLGRVMAREESGADVSQEFVDLEARARHLEAVERQFLVLLDRARTVNATLAVQSRLNQTQLELEQVRGRLRFLEDQTSFATITLALREHRVPAAKRDDGWGVLDAWRAGARAFVYVATRAFVLVAAVAPLVLVLGLLALAGVRIARRRRLVRSTASGS